MHFTQVITLESDPNTAARDRYGRILAYVRTEDGIDFNLALIQGGYAKVSIYNRDSSLFYQRVI